MQDRVWSYPYEFLLKAVDVDIKYCRSGSVEDKLWEGRLLLLISLAYLY